MDFTSEERFEDQVKIENFGKEMKATRKEELKQKIKS